MQGKPTARLRSHTEFTISHYQQLNSWWMQEEMGPKRLTYEEDAGLTPTSPQAPVAVLLDQQALNNTQGEVSMELMRMSDTNRFLGVYPDLRLPIPGNPHISQVFFNNTQVRSRDDSPMTLVIVLGMTHQYGTSISAIDHISGRFNILSQDGVQPFNLYRWVDDNYPSHPETSSAWPSIQLLMPLASSTPFLTTQTSTQESPALPPTLSTIGASDDNTFRNPSSSQTTTINPCRIAIKEVSSTSTLPEEDCYLQEGVWEGGHKAFKS